MENTNENIIKLISEGKTYTEIGTLIGLTREAIRQRCIKLGIKRRSFLKYLPKEKSLLQKLKASGLKWCSKCKRTEDSVKLHKLCFTNKKYYYYCNECQSKRSNEYYHTEKGKEIIIKANKKYNNKIKIKFI